MDSLATSSKMPYNSLQIGTVIAFAITYFIATTLLGLRYFQAIKLVKKVEVDLSKFWLVHNKHGREF